MHAIVASVAAALVLSSVTAADARPRFRFKSSSPSPVASPVMAPAPVPRAKAPAAASGSGSVLPAAVIGGVVGSRAARARSERGDTPTGSTTPSPDRGALAPVSAAPPAAAEPPQPTRKPRPVCAPGASFGGGFCAVN